MKTRILTRMTWWLRKDRPFNINDQYEIELLKIDPETGTVQVLVRNLATGEEHVAGK